LGLRDLGLRVGLLDADIYGPSVPRLTGIREKPQLNDQKKMIPLARFGLSIMSIGFLVEEDTAMIWRGPMVMSAITQMLRDVAWGTLDVLVVDMPPGTGDVQEGQCARARHRREHELFPVPALRHTLGHFRPWRGAPRGREARGAVPRRGAAPHGDSRDLGRRQPRRGERAGRAACG